METIIFACISLVFLIPIFYFLPLGIAFREKVILMGAAMIAAIAGLVANLTYNPWLGALLSLLLLVVFTYLFEKKTELFAFTGKEQVSEELSYDYSADSTRKGKEAVPAANVIEQDDQEFEQLLYESTAESKIVDFDSQSDLDQLIFEESDHVDDSKPLLELEKNETPEVAPAILTSEEFEFLQSKLDAVEDEDNQPISSAEEVEAWDEDLFLEVLETKNDKEDLIEEGTVLTDPTVSVLPEVVEEWDEELFLEVVELEDEVLEVVEEWDKELFLEVLEPEEATIEVVEEARLIEISSPVDSLVEEAAPEEGKPDEIISLAELLESEEPIEVTDDSITEVELVAESDQLEETLNVEMSTSTEAAASLDEPVEWLGQTVVEEIDSEEIIEFLEEVETEESKEQVVEVIADSALEVPVMTDIDNSDDQLELVQEERQPEQQPVHKTKLQQELFQTLIEQLKLAKKQLSDSDYEQLVSSYLDESLPHQDYYTFATLLIQQYVQTKNHEKLQQLLINLESKFQAYPVVLAEISYLKNRFCKE